LKPNPFFRRILTGSTVPLFEKGIRTVPTTGATTETDPVNS
jgi:hypothetical protein